VCTVGSFSSLNSWGKIRFAAPNEAGETVSRANGKQKVRGLTFEGVRGDGGRVGEKSAYGRMLPGDAFEFGTGHWSQDVH